MQQQPTLCRPEAFYYFGSQMATIDTTQGLLNASVGISMHALRDVDAADVWHQLRTLAHCVRRRVRGRQPQASLAHLHDVLFEEEGFRGNGQDYYNPRNSYISAVLDTRRGIPITLSLVYKVVAEEIGLEVEGVNAPGHFLVRVKLPEGPMLVDPFFGGGVLTPSEAFDRIERITGRHTPRTAEYLAAAQHSQWISRMLVNLQHIFASNDQRADLAAMSELQSLLDYSVY
jgi:regulator of sirC expression with transglutaminase-like and TPR domain